MTHTGPMPDTAGDFSQWKPDPRPCPEPGCGQPVKYRTWESSDGAYEDYQYRCDAGHVWWIDGADA